MFSPKGSEATIMFDIFFGLDRGEESNIRFGSWWVTRFECRVSSALPLELFVSSEIGELWKLCWHPMTKQESSSTTGKPTSWLQTFLMVRISFLMVSMSRKFLQAVLLSLSLLAWVRQSHQHSTFRWDAIKIHRQGIRCHFQAFSIIFATRVMFFLFALFTTNLLMIFPLGFHFCKNWYFCQKYYDDIPTRSPLKDFQTRRTDTNPSGGLQPIASKSRRIFQKKKFIIMST